MKAKLFFLNSIAIRDNLSELLCYLTYRDFLQLQFCSGALNLLIQLQFKHSFFLISLFTKLSLEILIVTHLFYVYWLNFVTKFFNSPLLTFWVCFQYCNQWVNDIFDSHIVMSKEKIFIHPHLFFLIGFKPLMHLKYLNKIISYLKKEL